LEKLIGYICWKCAEKIDRKKYASKPEVMARAHDYYIKRKNKLTSVPTEVSVCSGKGCLLDTVNTK
jgi:hypothetical protein